MQRLLTLLQGSQFKLKLFVWLVFLTLALVCATSKVACVICTGIFEWTHKDSALPKITLMLIGFHHSGWLWIMLLPWFAYCLVAGLRPAITIEGALLYAASAALAGALLLLVTVFALLLPYMVIR